MAPTGLHGLALSIHGLPVISTVVVRIPALRSTVGSATPTPALSPAFLARVARRTPAHEQDHAEEDTDEQQDRDR